jgi:DNA-binding response OmpR family regulator
VTTVLVVDDESGVRDLLSDALRIAGYETEVAGDGAEALTLWRSRTIDLCIVDINMPRMDGFEFLEAVRRLDPEAPVLLLSARDAPSDIARGLRIGADDYVRKPFSTRVLLARIDAILRRRDARAREHADDAPPIVRGKLVIRSERVEVAYDGAPIAVTLSELRLLEALVRRPGVVLSRARLLEQVRGDDSVVVDRIIDTYVRRLRRKIEAIDAAFTSIETVVGVGYRWRDDGS